LVILWQAAAAKNTTRSTAQSEVEASYSHLKPKVYAVNNSKLFPNSWKTPCFLYGDKLVSGK
jgi:hypothetical protein